MPTAMSPRVRHASPPTKPAPRSASTPRRPRGGYALPAQLRALRQRGGCDRRQQRQPAQRLAQRNVREWQLDQRLVCGDPGRSPARRPTAQRPTMPPPPSAAASTPPPASCTSPVRGPLACVARRSERWPERPRGHREGDRGARRPLEGGVAFVGEDAVGVADVTVLVGRDVRVGADRIGPREPAAEEHERQNQASGDPPDRSGSSAWASARHYHERGCRTRPQASASRFDQEVAILGCSAS